MGDESPKPASTPTGAVFLSYASQDAEAAQRICDALRAAGIEVWFDQTEKQSNSGLNTFDDRHQNVVIANYYRQDFIWPGYTTEKRATASLYATGLSAKRTGAASRSTHFGVDGQFVSGRRKIAPSADCAG